MIYKIGDFVVITAAKTETLWKRLIQNNYHVNRTGIIVSLQDLDYDKGYPEVGIDYFPVTTYYEDDAVRGFVYPKECLRPATAEEIVAFQLIHEIRR